jgi:hypothetical protein
MRWSAEEALRRALPYGRWRWRDPDGQVVDTIFNRKYQALATRVGGVASGCLVDPPQRMTPAEYYFGCGVNSPRNGYPWRTVHLPGCLTAPAVRRHCEAIARDWGLDPAELYQKAAAEIRAQRLKRRGGRFGRRRFE